METHGHLAALATVTVLVLLVKSHHFSPQQEDQRLHQRRFNDHGEKWEASQ